MKFNITQVKERLAKSEENGILGIWVSHGNLSTTAVLVGGADRGMDTQPENDP